jgi:hypothetical protein
MKQSCGRGEFKYEFCKCYKVLPPRTTIRETKPKTIFGIT